VRLRLRELPNPQIEADARKNGPLSRTLEPKIGVSLAASSPRGLLGLILNCSFVKNPRPGFRLFRSIVSFLPVRCVPAVFLAHALLG
jgi:pimeloyl-[acyl-carrier protein] methyl ester esterase